MTRFFPAFIAALLLAACFSVPMEKVVEAIDRTKMISGAMLDYQHQLDDVERKLGR